MVVGRIAIHTRQHQTDITLRHTGLGQQVVQLLLELFLRGAETHPDACQLCQVIHLVVGRQQHRHGHLTTGHHTLDTYIAHLLQLTEISLGHLIVTSNEGRLNLAQLHLHPGILHGQVEADATMRIGGVITMRLRIDGQRRTYGIVGRLHEIGGTQRLLPILGHTIKDTLRVVETTQTCSRYDGIGMLDTRILQHLQRSHEGTLHQAAHASGFVGCHIVAERRVLGLDEWLVIAHRGVHPLF